MNADHVDKDTIDMLKEVMEDGFNALLETYIDDSKTRIEALKKALASGDSEEVRRTAHSLKGSSSNLGASRMASLCLNVENCGKGGKLQGLENELADIEQEYAVVADIMKGMI